MFDGFTPSQFAYIKAYDHLCNLVVLFVIVPLIKFKLKWHETSMLVTCTFITAATYFLFIWPKYKKTFVAFNM